MEKRNILWIYCKSPGRFLLFLFLIISIDTLAQRDLPNPASNLQEIPAGCYIVPMDTVYQAIVPAGAPPFNLRAYGLIYNLLQNGVHVKWAIRTPKQRDDIDFSAMAEMYSPHASPAAMMDFRGGPFIVPDTILPCGTSTTDIINLFGNNVAVYRLSQNTTVDIGYTLTHRPKIAVFNNGGNQQIHTKILEGAGIYDYDIMDAANIRDLMNCYTFASEPHADPHQVSMEVIEGVRAYVLNGGNFLAQCHAVETYENQGFFHTTNGIAITNSGVSHLYPNADLAYSQMHGPLEENEGGSVNDWTLAEGSNWRPYAYRSVSHTSTDTVVAMGAKLTDPATPGGNVYYLGGHDYGRTRGPRNPVLGLTTLPRLNALRMYLNAAIVSSGNPNMAWANAGGPATQIGCTDSVMLGCIPTGPPQATFLWTPSDGLSCTTCPNPMASPSQTTTYRVDVTHGCTVSDTIQVLVEANPVAGFSNTTVCAGIATSFTNETTGGGNYWQWNFGDPDSGENNTSNLQNPSHTFSRAGNFDVTLISGTGTECSDTIVQTVVVNTSPLLSTNAPYICEGQTTILTVEGAESYVWSTGETGNSISVTPTETTQYFVTGTFEGCSNTDTVTVTVSPDITATSETTNVSCFGGNDGSAMVNVSGGIGNYSYNWDTSPEQTDAQATNLTEGTYTVITSDSLGCTDTASVNIYQPEILESHTETIDVTCAGINDGSATVDVSGGTSPYTFRWNTDPEQTTGEITGLSEGSYTVVVTDLLGCTDTTSATILQPDGFSLVVETTEVSCFEGNDGTATVTATGGSLPYTYSWNTLPEQNSMQATSLSEGSYIITVTDFSGCMASDTAVIIQPEALELSIESVNVSCFEGNNGSATVNVTGGRNPYSYSWDTNPEQTTDHAANLSEGIYRITVLDSLNCQETTTVEITQPQELVLNTEVTNISCFGGNDGSASVTAIGGTAPYAYSWNTSPEQNTGQANALVLGNHTVTVTDSLGCTETASIEVLQPDALTLGTAPSHVSCFGGDDGSAVVTAAGGTAPYTYRWDTNPEQTTIEVVGLAAGSYTVTVTDSLLCSENASVSITEPQSIILNTSTTDVSCYEGDDGTATVNATGGTEPYVFSWNTNPIQTTANANALLAGDFTVTVSDALQCSEKANIIINEPEPVSISISVENPTCISGGTATATVAGGTAPYHYEWNSSPIQNTATAVGLEAGNYTMIVRDNNDCAFTSNVTLNPPPMPIADFSFLSGCFGEEPVSFRDQSVMSNGVGSSQIISREWNFGDPGSGSANFSNENNPQHNYNAAAIYEASLVIVTDLSCTDTVQKPIEVYPIPVVNFGPPAEGCSPLCVEFKDSSTIASGHIQSWSWNFGNPSSQNNTSSEQNSAHCYLNTGSYNVRLEVVSNHGCTAALTRENLVQVRPDPERPYLQNQKICTDGEEYTQLGVESIAGHAYYWEYTGDTSSIITVKDPGDHHLMVTNQWGCTAEASANVRDVCPPRLFVGNAFSPDGDGINDLFRVHHAFVGDFQMLIFNRWGEIIYESRDKNEFWDGNYRNEPMPVGVYPWVIVYEGDSVEYRGPYKLEGSVTVIR
ncbi:MAG: PKD domain-containing protein [Cytophagaceae bacterium]